MPNIEEIMQNVIERAKEDSEFRVRLEQNPVETLQAEGLNISEDELQTFLAENCKAGVEGPSEVLPKCGLQLLGRISKGCQWLLGRSSTEYQRPRE